MRSTFQKWQSFVSEMSLESLGAYRQQAEWGIGGREWDGDVGVWVAWSH